MTAPPADDLTRAARDFAAGDDRMLEAILARADNRRPDEDPFSWAERARSDVEKGLTVAMLRMPTRKKVGRFVNGILTAKAGDKPGSVRTTASTEDGSRVLILENGERHLQLSVRQADIQEAVVDGIRSLTGPLGLKVFLVAVAEAGDRGENGRLILSMERLLDRIQATRHQRRNPEFRVEITKTILAMTALRMVDIEERDDGTRKTTLHVLSCLTERAWINPDGTVREIEAVDLQIHPDLYRGLKHPVHYFPLPERVLGISHARNSHAIQLAVMLALHYRRRLVAILKTGDPTITLKGSTLYDFAGIERDIRNPARAEARLRKAFEELARVGMLGDYRWTDHPWALGGRCEIKMHRFIEDHVVRRVRRLAGRSRPLVTGRDLIERIEKLGISKSGASERLQVDRKTLRKAYQDPESPLPRAIVDSLKERPGRL